MGTEKISALSVHEKIYFKSERSGSVIIVAMVNIHNDYWIHDGIRDTIITKRLVQFKGKNRGQADSLKRVWNKLAKDENTKWINGK